MRDRSAQKDIYIYIYMALHGSHVFCLSSHVLPNKQIERLQRIQNQAARMLKRIPRRNHITPVLRELH